MIMNKDNNTKKQQEIIKSIEADKMWTEVKALLLFIGPLCCNGFCKLNKKKKKKKKSEKSIAESNRMFVWPINKFHQIL